MAGHVLLLNITLGTLNFRLISTCSSRSLSRSLLCTTLNWMPPS